jgi:O-antigen ligase
MSELKTQGAQGQIVEAGSAPRFLLPPVPSVVGFYFAARLSITYLFFQSDPQQGTAVSLALSLLTLLASAFCSFGPAAAPQRSPWRVPCFRWVAAFLGFALISLAWSETVSLVNSLAYWCGFAADVASVLVLLRTGSIENVGALILQGYVVGACFIACVMWGSPTMVDLRPGNDEFFSPNAIGFTCAFGIFLSQFLLSRARVWRFPAIFLAISLLRSLSKTTILAFAVSQLILLFTDRSVRRGTKVRIVAAALAVLAAFSGLIAAYYNVYTNAGNQAETLTGRAGIWLYITDRSLERPWLGHGFNSVWKVIPPFGPDQFEAWHAHNELLQQFYSYGVVGIVLLIGIYGSFFLQARRLKRSDHRAIFVSLILFIVFRGLADTERFDLSFPLWSVALIGLIMAQSEESISGQVTAVAR